MRKLTCLFGIIFFCATVGKTWHWAKDGFSIVRTKVWENGLSETLGEEAVRALEQPFHYLARGHQCYAFESEDGQFVIKLPRTDRYRLPFWLRSINLPILANYREKIRTDLSRRETFILESFRIAYEELRGQTALLAMHLQISENLGKTVVIFDRLGRSYQLPLHQTAFILQRKKAILMNVFQEALQCGERATAEQMLDAFLEVIAERAKHGILNKDPSFLKNFGFGDAVAFQIDIGSFYRKEGIVGQDAYEKSIRETTGPVRDWLAKQDPEMLKILDQKLTLLYERPI
jgi:hypothetical protein